MEDSRQLKFAGDINVESVSIRSLITGKKFNVAHQLATIHIYEDMFSPFITGSLIFVESLDFANNFPFVGEEVVELKVFTPTLDQLSDNSGIIQGTFYIYKMADREQIAEKNCVYQLHFVSIEAITDINTKLSKGFDGVISDIATKLLKDENALATKKHITVEATGNKTKYVSNFWSPIKNINYITELAVTTEKLPTYVFFENRNGFNFVSLDLLNSQKPVQEFEYNNSSQVIDPTGGSKRNIQLDYKRITEFHIPVSHDYMDKVTSGAYGSTMIFSDLTTKQYFNLKYSMFENPDKQTHLNKYPLASKNVFTTYRAAMFNDSIQTGLFTNYTDVSNVRNRQQRISRIKLAEANKIQIIVPGRTDYTVGQTVYLKIFKSEPIRKEDSEDEILDNIISGNYLISSINHEIDRQKHECHIELIKDTLMINLDKGATT
jgi:hypothetical protein